MAEPPLTPQGFAWSRRPGIKGFPGWRGMVTEGDPASIPINSFQLLRNFRFKGGFPYTRPGHTLYGDVGEPVFHLSAFPVVNPHTRLWVSILGCFGAAIGTGARLIHYDPDQDPTIQVYANYYAEASRQSPLGVYGGDLYIGDKSLLRKPVLITAPQGVDLQNIINSPTDAPIYDFGSTFTITWMKEFDGKLFIGLSTGGGGSKIATWDGLSIKDDLTGVRPSFAAEVFRGTRLVTGFDATAGDVRYRELGASPGTWVSVPLAGFSTSVSGNAMQEHRDMVLIAGGNRDLYKYHEPAGVPTLVSIHNIGTADNAGNGITAVATMNGLAFYLWNGASPNYATKLGLYDAQNAGGSTEFTDTRLDVTGNVANFKGGFGLTSYRGALYMTGAAQWLLATAPNDVSSASIQTILNGGVPGGGINFPGLQLLVY